MEKKITKNTKLSELMQINPEAGMVLFEYGLHCIGCGLAASETLEQGCKAHGMKKKEIKEILAKLNKEKKIKKKKPEKKKEIKKLPVKKQSIKDLKEMVK